MEKLVAGMLSVLVRRVPAAMVALSLTALACGPLHAQTNPTITNVDIDGQGTSAEIMPGATFDVELDYTIWNPSGCPGCIAEIVLGIDEDGQDCAYIGIPPVEPGVSGHGTATLTAPTGEGVYEIRFSHELQVSCELAVAMYDAYPPEDDVIGIITVTDFNPTITNVDIDGQGASAEIMPGATFDVELDYTIWNPDVCPGCIAEIVIGIDEDGQDCAYIGMPPVEPGVSGHGTATLTAPTGEGIYEIRYSHELQVSCELAVARYDDYPPEDDVIGIIIVTDFNPTITNVDIDGQGTSAAVLPGATFDVELDYTIWNPDACPGCIAEIVIGIGEDGQDCAYMGMPPVQPGVSGHGTATLTAPMTEGVYEIRYSHELQVSCELAVARYDDYPPEGNVIGVIDVMTVAAEPRSWGYIKSINR